MTDQHNFIAISNMTMLYKSTLALLVRYEYTIYFIMTDQMEMKQCLEFDVFLLECDENCI